MAGTVAAGNAVAEHNAVGLDPNGMANHGRGLLCHGNGLDSACGTHGGALNTLGTAGATLKAEFRLHEP